MASIQKLNLTGVRLSSSVKALINSRHYNDKNEIVSNVPTVDIVSALYGTTLPSASMSFDDFIKSLQTQTNSEVRDANNYLSSQNLPTIKMPTGSAFNNCNGKWTEYAYAAFAWNSLAKLNRNNKSNAGNNGSHTVYIYVKLPNRSSDKKDWTQLLTPDIHSALDSYPQSHSAEIHDTHHSNFGRRFELISSNPDAIILKYDNVKALGLWQATGINNFDFYTDITSLNENTIFQIESLFHHFRESVLPSANLQCFISIKNSTRPDRRYQWVHEGDHVKTILQWISVYPGLDAALLYSDLDGKFFAIALSDISDADKDALNTGLAGSIVSPSLLPVWAVDKLFQCTKFADIDSQINEMLNF